VNARLIIITVVLITNLISSSEITKNRYSIKVFKKEVQTISININYLLNEKNRTNDILT
jgi:hypothetical protein